MTVFRSTNPLEVKEHSGRLVCSGNQRKGHQVVLQVHNGRLVDRKPGLIRNCDLDNLRRLVEARLG